jgi:phosphate-selective porin OprO/OprP
MLKRLTPTLLPVAVAAIFPFSAYAESTDAEARINELQKQMQALSQELQAVQQQLAQNKEAKVAEKGKSKGEPVYASFKDGLVFDDGTGNWALQFNGRIQADYRSIDPEEWKNDTFSVRRARLGGTFTFLKDFAVRVEGEYANSNDGAKGTTALTYGYLEYNHLPGARVRVGQFKPIFGLERAESTNFTDFMELSLATATGASFNSTYDRGLMLFGAPIKGTYYNLSYVNGSGQNNDDTGNSKDVVGRVAANIADWAEWKDAVVHVGVSGSKGRVQASTQPNTAPNSAALSGYTESNGITSNTAGYSSTTATKFFSTAAFTGNEVDKERLGLETALAFGPVKFQSEYITTNFDGHTLAGKNVDKDIDAWYASLTWLVTGESYASTYKNGMFNRLTPKHNFAWGKDGFGAVELGLRYSSFDASDFKTAGCIAGSGCLTAATATTAYTNKADAWTAGAKWILTPNARLMLNYVHTSFDTPVKINSKASDDEDAITMRAQYDF